MSRFFVGLALWALLLALAACGGDSKGTDPAMDTELAEMVDTVVSTYDDLTVCTDKREGATAYVEDEKKAYVYKNGFWVVDDSLTKEIESDLEKKSSDGKSNSSGKNNSSNPDVSTVSLASPCKTATEDNCEYGTLTDDRDGQTYKTVKIGEQWWMAENLNYAYTGVPFKYVSSTDSNLVYYSDSTSWCYDNDAANCAKYGRLYTWAAAMDSAGIIPGNTANGCGYGEICNLGNVKVRGVCPEGWHLPSIVEWITLRDAAGGGQIVGRMLKSTEGWTEGWKRNGNGTDNFGFSALPAGYRYYAGFDREGDHAYFWSSTESDSYMDLDYSSDRVLYYDKNIGFSVRCLKD